MRLLQSDSGFQYICGASSLIAYPRKKRVLDRFEGLDRRSPFLTRYLRAETQHVGSDGEPRLWSDSSVATQRGRRKARSQQVTCDLPYYSVVRTDATGKVLSSRHRLGGTTKTILRRRIRLRPRKLTAKLTEVAANLAHVYAGLSGDLANRHSSDQLGDDVVQ